MSSQNRRFLISSPSIDSLLSKSSSFLRRPQKDDKISHQVRNDISYCKSQINWEILSDFCGFLRKPEPEGICCQSMKYWIPLQCLFLGFVDQVFVYSDRIVFVIIHKRKSCNLSYVNGGQCSSLGCNMVSSSIIRSRHQSAHKLI